MSFKSHLDVFNLKIIQRRRVEKKDHCSLKPVLTLNLMPATHLRGTHQSVL